MVLIYHEISALLGQQETTLLSWINLIGQLTLKWFEFCGLYTQLSYKFEFIKKKKLGGESTYGEA